MFPNPIYFVVFSVFMLMPTASFASVWKYEKMVDDFTDEVKSVAYRRFDGLKGIAVYCFPDSGDIRVSIFVDSHLNSKSELVRVKFRFDSGPVVETTWVAGNNGDMVWESNGSAVRFSRFLQTSKKLVFEATANDDKNHRIRFELSNSGESIQKVLNDCGK